MLDMLKMEANRTYTENGAVSNRSTFSECLDLFGTVGGLRHADEEMILDRFVRASNTGVSRTSGLRRAGTIPSSTPLSILIRQLISSRALSYQMSRWFASL